MKIRSGFVSNSSSSSFVLYKGVLTDEQIEKFNEFREKFNNSDPDLVLKYNLEHDEIEYYISEKGNYFVGYGESHYGGVISTFLESINVSDYELVYM